MAITEQKITNEYSIYLGDAMEVLPKIPNESIDLCIYSPPFGGLYQYSSNERDLSNCLNREEFFQHYEFIVEQIANLIRPGRMAAVHSMDIPTGNTGLDHLYDFPGDIIRLHEKFGFRFVARHMIWKEPLTVRNRTMTKSLSHKCITLDSSKSSIANADQLLIFRAKGTNTIPVVHPRGFREYAGSTPMPSDYAAYKDWQGSQLQNRYSHWIWQQYASSVWMDVRIDNVLPYRDAKDEEEEKHCHPLQLDVIARCIDLYSNPGEIVLTPFMGVGSEVYQAVRMGRKAIGIELKPSYYRQSLKNIEHALDEVHVQQSIFDKIESEGINHDHSGPYGSLDSDDMADSGTCS